MKRFIEEEAESTLSAEQENMKLEGVSRVFRSFLEKMEVLDKEIEEVAKKILPQNWSPADDTLRKERGYTLLTNKFRRPSITPKVGSNLLV